jgi:predicted Rossmann-fold nucleotide-binding protein
MKRLCVFCGSGYGAHPAYRRAAKQLGAALVREHIGLVFGGANVGLMGELAKAVLHAGGDVVGVMPRNWHSSNWPICESSTPCMSGKP